MHKAMDDAIKQYITDSADRLLANPDGQNWAPAMTAST